MRLLLPVLLGLAATASVADDGTSPSPLRHERSNIGISGAPRLMTGSPVHMATKDRPPIGPAAPVPATNRSDRTGVTNPPDPNPMGESTQPPQEPASEASPATNEQLELEPDDVKNLPAERRTALAAAIDAAATKWNGFGSRGGAASGVLQRLSALKASLSTGTPAEPSATDGDPAASTRDSFPPNCSFTARATTSGSKHRRVVLTDINFIDRKDPLTNIASGARRVRFSNDGRTWREFTPDAAHPADILWTVDEPGDDGMVTIFMQAGDNEGNWGNGSETTFVQRVRIAP